MNSVKREGGTKKREWEARQADKARKQQEFAARQAERERRKREWEARQAARAARPPRPGRQASSIFDPFPRRSGKQARGWF